VIPYTDYKEQTRNRKPASAIYELFWWSEDYVINNKLIRYSGTKSVCRETLGWKYSDNVHVNDMGEHVE
jgi:hypothetical protein